MSRMEGEWQKTVDEVWRRLKNNATDVKAIVPREALPTVNRLLNLAEIKVAAALGDAGFTLDPSASRLTLGVGGLNLIYEAGKVRDFEGLDEEAFCEVAVSLYLFHEAHHVEQGLVDFDDVQRLKRTAGYDKLGEVDLIADAVAAQIFAAVHTVKKDRRTYAAAFYNALRFMIAFCFPAFGFPSEKRHKSQRALGVVLMALSAELALKKNTVAMRFDAPIFPYFSPDYSEVAILEYAKDVAVSVVRFSERLHPEAVQELLEIIDDGDAIRVLEKARILV